MSLLMKAAAAEVGGLYGINVETLTGDKTLTPGTDKIYQYLDEGDADRTITLDTASATDGDRFVIRHNGDRLDSHKLTVKQAAIELDKIYVGNIKHFIFNGTDWVPAVTGTGENDTKNMIVGLGTDANARDSGTAIGYAASAWQDGVAVGMNAYAKSYGVAVGMAAEGYTYGAAVGRSSKGANYGTAIGCYANSDLKKYSNALGPYSKAIRTSETTTNIDGNTGQTNNVVQGRWAREIAGGAGATEIFCGGQANQRFTIRPSSVLAFDMVIVARDNVANEVARYSVHDGLIKRDGANNTVMVLCTVTVDHEDDAGWDCAVTADDANEALIITVTGDGVNVTQWAAVMNGVETHF